MKKDCTRLDLLKSAIGLLAADSTVQLRYLESSEKSMHVDELALDFDAIVAAADDMLEAGEIDDAQCLRIKAIHKRLEEMSGQDNAALWTPQALSYASECNEVREQAKDCLKLFTEE